MEKCFDNPSFWQWVDEHMADDPARLLLSWRGREPWIDEAVMQIECRRKYRRKLPAEIACGRFYFPTSLSGEQSTSDELALMHADMIPEGTATMVDLTSGLGIDVTTAARVRGIKVTAVERDPVVAEALRHNAKVLGVDVNVVCGDCRDFLAEVPDGAFDVAFIDPARRDASGGRVNGLADCSPDVVEMLPLLRRKVRTLIVKMSPMLDVTQVVRKLPGTTDVWALGTPTECRELVVRVPLHDSDATTEPIIHAVTSKGEFTFTRAEEADAEVKYGAPKAGGWLYEPWPVVMKVGPWRLLSQQFGVYRLQQNTGLYYSPEPVEGFPGEGREVIEVLPFASSVLKRLVRSYPHLQVAVRNFPMPADTLRRKLRVTDGHNAPRLIAATVTPDTPMLLILKP